MLLFLFTKFLVRHTISCFNYLIIVMQCNDVHNFSQINERLSLASGESGDAGLCLSDLSKTGNLNVIHGSLRGFTTFMRLYWCWVYIHVSRYIKVFQCIILPDCWCTFWRHSCIYMYFLRMYIVFQKNNFWLQFQESWVLTAGISENNMDTVTTSLKLCVCIHVC